MVFTLAGGALSPPKAAAVAATALVWLFWQTEQSFPPLPPGDQIAGFFSRDALRSKLFHEGPVPVSILWSFVFGMVALLLTRRDILGRLSRAEFELLEYNQGKRQLGSVTYYGEIISALMRRHREDNDLSAVLALKEDLLGREEEKAVLALEPVKWAEWTLPMLGFLGTVIGIGEAITEVSRGVFALLSRGSADVGAVGLDNFNRGFAGMALAFNTTFLGLAGLIILGSLRSWSKKAIAEKLRIGRELIGDWVAGSITEGTDLVDEVRGVRFAVGGLQAQVALLSDQTARDSARAAEARDKILTTAERVIVEGDSETYQVIRNVLLRPIVTLESGSVSLQQETWAHIERLIGTEVWRIVSVGSSSMTRACVAIIRAEIHDDAAERDRIFWFMPEGERDGPLYDAPVRLRAIWALAAGALAITEDDDRLVRLTRTDAPELKMEVLADDFSASDSVLVIQSPNTTEAEELVLLARSDQLGLTLRRIPDETLHHLAGRRLISWCYQAQSLFLLVEQAGQGQELVWLSLEHSNPPATQNPAEQVESEPATQGIRVRAQHAAVSRDVRVASIAALSRSSVFLLDDAGRPLYWDSSFTTGPIALRQNDWRNVHETTVRGGAGGWVAVMAEFTLQMWRVSRGGFLSRYNSPEPFMIGGTRPSDFVVTGDGAWLVGFRDKALLVYRFPSYLIDSL